MKMGEYNVSNLATTKRPFCAAFMLIEQGGKYLFVKRKNTAWMDGYYGLPSGKVERGEGFLEAAVREAKEEVGVTVRLEDAEFVHLSCRNDDMEWCDVMFLAKKWSGEPRNAEPDMHEEIAWFALDALPENVVPPVGAMLEAWTAGKTYSEYHSEC